MPATKTRKPTAAQARAILDAINTDGRLAFSVAGSTRRVILESGWATREAATEPGTVTDAGRAAVGRPVAEIEQPDEEITDEMIRVLRSASPLNGLVTVYVGAEGDEMVSRHLLWTPDDGDYFLDYVGAEWLRNNPA